jgi:ribosomal protein S18 acetylase RimI-like enzyme
LETAFAEFHRRGYRRAGLSVDATNPTGAVALYESVGMKSLYEAILYEVDSIGPSPAGSMMSLSKNV